MTFDPTKVHQVSNFLFRGPRPPSFEWLSEHNFKTVINLQSGVFQFFHNDTYEQEQKTAELKSYNLHWSDVFAPSKSMLLLVVHLMNRAHKDNKTYIHCLHGEDRTGMACAAYRIVTQNWGRYEATAEMKRLGFHTFPYWFWINRLRELK